MGYTLTIPETAARLGVSKFTVRAWLRQRRLAYHKLGRRVVIGESDVREFLSTNRVEAIPGRIGARSE